MDLTVQAVNNVSGNFEHVFSTIVENGTGVTISQSVHEHRYVRLGAMQSQVLTFENDATSNWFTDAEVIFRIAGTGIPSVAGAGIIFSGTNPTGFSQFDTFAVKRVGGNLWDII
tara:strand:- start:875 stop:1216 length:342 start_codon:yes stop_codon:yes gene_type:complete